MRMSRLAGKLVWFAVWFVVLPAMTVLLGVPAAAYLVAKQSKGGLPAFAGWAVAGSAGWVPTFAGPFGMPTPVFWAGVTLFGLWFAAGFVVLGRSAWSTAIRNERLMRVHGMPSSEII